MNVDSWKQNLLSRISDVSNDAILEILRSDKTLYNGVIDFFEPDDLRDIVLLYSPDMWDFKSFLDCKNVICCPYLEGKSSDKIEWEGIEVVGDKMQLSYLVLGDGEDSLYEWKMVSEHYGLDVGIEVKCLVDNREKEEYFVENRAGLVVNSVISRKNMQKVKK